MATTPQERTSATPGELRQALSNRQMTMIAIGGVIGAGLFVGSGTAIADAGPAVLVAYAGVALIVLCVMRMLAELAVADPTSGSFATYAGRYLAPWAGTCVGLLYAYQWCVVIGFEAIVGAKIVATLLPGVPNWLAALVLLAALIGVNLTKVESYGTFEYWFAMVKVAAIIAFLLIGLVAIVGLLPGHPAPGLSNLTGQGGFAPNGWGVVVTASLVVFFSYFGTEAVTIAAGEADHPQSAVRRAMASVVWRIVVFYVGSILVAVTLLPWNSGAVIKSPYVAVFESLGLPAAALVMQFVVLTAVLSCLNSGIYTSSRMLYALAHRGEIPAVLGRTNRSGIPVAAVIAASAGGIFTVIANYFLPTESVYEFLLDSSGAVALLVYLFIVVTHLRARRRLDAQAPERPVRMPGFPVIDLLVLAVILLVAVGMTFTASSARSLLLTLLVAVVFAVGAMIRHRRGTVDSADRAHPQSRP